MSNFASDKNILNFDLADLRGVVSECGDKPYRGEQVFSWLAKGVRSFEDMGNVPADLRTRLASEYYIGLPKVIARSDSKDGTVKCLYEFADGAEVESVFMKYSYGNSVCISSQAGCRMGCSFCASTIDGLERNLTRGEMLAEILEMRNQVGEDIGHVVVMGMGEPFDNYGELIAFLRLVHDEKGYNLGLRNITVSTCGLIPEIRRFAEDMPQVNLAVSLHAPNQELRERIMPIAKKYSYDDLLNACREYTDKTSRRITFEYALMDEVNDTTECAEELAARLKGMLAHVNLIPLNEVSGRQYKKSKADNVHKFQDILEQNGIAVSVRRTLGADIDAACGQLRQRSDILRHLDG